MTRNDINTKVREVLAEQMGMDPQEAEAVKDESNLCEDLGADSLDIVEIIMALESAFGIEINDDVAEKSHTVADIVNYLESLSSVAAQ